MLIGAGEIISRSFHLYKENFGLFLKYILLTLIPVPVLLVGILVAGFGGLLTDSTTESGGAGLGVGIVVGVLAFVVFLVLSLWFGFTFIRVIAARYMQIPVRTVGEELKDTRGVILAGLGVSILFGLIVVGGLILLIIPGIIFSVWYYFATYGVVIDRQEPMQALGTSKKLVAGRWFGVFWRMLAPGFVFAILVVILQMVIGLPLGFMSSPDSTGTGLAMLGVSTIINLVINVLSIPLTTSAITILYVELKKTPVLQAPAVAPTTTT